MKDKNTVKATFTVNDSNSGTLEQLIHKVVTTPRDIINFLEAALEGGEDQFYIILGALGEKYQGKPLKFNDSPKKNEP